MKCYKCQKEMSVGDSNYCGVKFHVTVEDPFPLKFIKKQWGKYYEDAVEEINFCWECLLDALLGVK